MIPVDGGSNGDLDLFTPFPVRNDAPFIHPCLEYECFHADVQDEARKLALLTNGHPIFISSFSNFITP